MAKYSTHSRRHNKLVWKQVLFLQPSRGSIWFPLLVPHNSWSECVETQVPMSPSCVLTPKYHFFHANLLKQTHELLLTSPNNEFHSFLRFLLPPISIFPFTLVSASIFNFFWVRSPSSKPLPLLVRIHNRSEHRSKIAPSKFKFISNRIVHDSSQGLVASREQFNFHSDLGNFASYCSSGTNSRHQVARARPCARGKKPFNSEKQVHKRSP